MIGIGLGITTAQFLPFDPANMFGGRVGLLLSAARLSSLSQDAAGTTPANAPGQPVGLVRDLSGGNRHASQPTSAARPTLGRHPRFERRNLLRFTQDFEIAPWTTFGTVTRTANAALAPDGTMTADRLEIAAASGIYQNIFCLPSTRYTASIWVRADAPTTTALVSNTNPNDPSFLSVAVTTEWQRVSLTKTTGAGATTVNLQIDATYGANTIYVWGAQLELGPTTTPYQRITDGNPRRNLLIQSRTLNTAAWSAGTAGLALIGNFAARGVLGEMTATLLTENTAASPSRNRVQGVNVLNGQFYTMSAIVKSTGPQQRHAYLVYENGTSFSGNPMVVLNMVTGVLTQAGGVDRTVGAENLGNDWWRLWISCRCVADGLNGFRVGFSDSPTSPWGTYTGDGLSGLAVDGVQVELGSSMTAYQNVTTSFDVTEALPQEPRRNLLDWTEAFTNPVWEKSGGMTVTEGQPDPFGGNTAARVQFTGPNQTLLQYRYSGIPIGSALFGGVWVKGVAGETIRSRFFSPAEQNTVLTGEWQYISRASTSVATTDHFNVNTWGGATARDILVCRPQLEFGTAATAYQRIASQYLTPPMVPSVWYLSTDAIDDWLETAAFTWGSNEVTVVVAIQKDSDASVGNILSFGDFGANGGWRVSAPASAGVGDIGAFSGAGTNIFIANPGNTAPISAVISMQAKTQQPMVRLRRNGVQVAESLAGQGAAPTYGAGSPYALQIGRWYATQHFSGRIYALFAINRLLSPAELAQVERWAANEMGMVL